MAPPGVPLHRAVRPEEPVAAASHKPDHPLVWVLEEQEEDPLEAAALGVVIQLL